MLDNEKLLSLSSDLFIDDSSYRSLNECFKKHSSLHMDWVRLAAQAAKNVSTLKVKLKICAAKVAEGYRKEYLDKNKKPLPVTFDIKGDVVPKDKEWVKLNYALIEAEEELEIARGAAKAFAERGYLLNEVAEYTKATTLPTPKFSSPGEKLMEEAKRL